MLKELQELVRLYGDDDPKWILLKNELNLPFTSEYFMQKPEVIQENEPYALL